MKKMIFIVAIAFMTLCVNYADAEVSLIMNGSFEKDGTIDDITEFYPMGWYDVNLPQGDYGMPKFGASVWDDWSSDGDHYLALYSNGYESFSTGDIATISQRVYLEDVNDIIFDLSLDTSPGYESWDPQLRSAVLLIDGEVVWESNSVGSDVRGEYFDQSCTVPEIYKNADTHTLSFGIRANSDEPLSYIYYWAMLDFIKFDTHCGGYGYLETDLNHDCHVDNLDLLALTSDWLTEDWDGFYDFYIDQDDTINFKDYAVLAKLIDQSTETTDWQDENAVKIELSTADLNNDGIVNLQDFAIISEIWQGDGSRSRADIDRSGTVDADDLMVFAQQWLITEWAYWFK